MNKEEVLDQLKYIFLTNDVLSELISLSSVVVDKDQYFQAYFSTKIASKLTEQLQYQSNVLENIYSAIDDQFSGDAEKLDELNSEIKKIKGVI